MALAETAQLVARLSLKDDFSRPLAGVQGKLSGLGSAASRAGKAVAVGLGAGIAVGTVALTRAVEGGLRSLATLEDATTSVDAAIKQVGLTGKVTAQQISQWSKEIETSVQSAFDDKAITQAATTLIRYGKVTEGNLKPALVVMTDLAAKTGDVESAASLLARALADPTKAAGKLAKQGVILTKAQQDQIKAMVEAGDVAGAQTVLLKDLETATKGAAAAMHGPAVDSLNMWHDAVDEAEQALATGFLPVIEKVRTLLTTELAKPSTVQALKDFGEGLAGGLDSLVEIARKIPWGSIGDALKIGGVGAKAILDAFVSLPPWIQTAVVTGWGLNKLTGGALSGIVGQLASGLIKGILGINAGVVNINAAVVNGAGGVPGVPGGKGGGGLLGTAAKVVLPVAIVAVTGQAVLALAESFNPPGSRPSDLQGRINGTRGFVPRGPDPVRPITERQQEQLRVAAETQKAIETYRDESARAAIAAAGNAQQIQNATTSVQNATMSGTSQIVGAIARNRPTVNVSVSVVGTNVKVTKTYSQGDMGGGPSGKYQSGENQ